jgi:two-component system sensor histidine kinase KdpD
MPPDHRRPSPDALLDAAGREGRARGRLKIFLGAAPGVGKTYEMLQTARARLREGVDVVIGIVETHGRAETQALVEGLEIVPRQRVGYRGRTVEEMDLDAILARRPALVLVDELAHSNAPGSRHPKRHQDVEELLGAGIDVLTTINIQHVESLNDVVAQITRVRVRETVPDRILDLADDIEIVDLSPGDLIRRLEEGKVYLPDNAERALAHFFSPGNLTALRELALRRTAQRVDDQLLTHMQANAIAGPWAAGERILVCVGDDPRGAGLVRHAKRLADRLRAPWTALVLETNRMALLPEAERDRIAGVLRLAQSLGADAVTLPATRATLAEDVVAYARDNNVTQIVIGKSDRSRWFELLHGSVVHDLVRRAGTIAVQVVAGEELPSARRTPPARPAPAFSPTPYVAAMAATAVGLGFSLLVEPYIGIESVDLVFLTAVVGMAVRFGLWPSLATVILASLAYNFFFLPPTWTFTIADPTNVAALVLFAVVAVVVSNLAARAREQAVAARLRAHTTEALYGFSRKLATSGTLDDVLWASAYQIASMTRLSVVLVLPGSDGLEVAAAYPPEDRLDASDLAAARWTFENGVPAGRGADTLPGAHRLYLPLRTARGTIGVIGLDSPQPGALLTPDERRLLDALADQAALAIERVHLVADLDRARRDAETDRLRQALLTSLSHDLKTPLAAILGSAGALRDLDALLDGAAKTELLGTILEEAERLNRFIANLLDMTRLEAGALAPKLGAHDLADIISGALSRAGALLPAGRVRRDLPADLPMVEIDPILLEQALFNLLDNAAKHGGGTVTLEAREEGGRVVMRIMDEGPGLPPEDAERVFGKFYRVSKADGVPAGTGLGLAIARGFVEAMGGTLSAANVAEDGTGAVFTLSLPASRATLLGEAA